MAFPLTDKLNDKSVAVPTKSALRPPKLAPSAWQLYFTDWIQRHQASSHKKLNVAQAAKEAGQEYAKLSSEEKEVQSIWTVSHSSQPDRPVSLALQTPLAGRQECAGT
jgi:hypothetical protein